MNKIYPKIEELIDTLCQAEYERGFEDGRKAQKEADADSANHYGYEEYCHGEKIGREEVWDAAKKIVLNERDGGYSCNELNAIFGTARVFNIMENDVDRVLYLIRLHEAKRQTGTVPEDAAKCDYIGGYCPYPWLRCEECEVRGSIERARKKQEGAE